MAHSSIVIILTPNLAENACARRAVFYFHISRDSDKQRSKPLYLSSVSRLQA